MSCPVYFTLLIVLGLWLSEICVCGPTDMSKISTFDDHLSIGSNNKDEVAGIHISISRTGKKQHPIDCAEVQDRRSGVYKIKPQSRVIQGPINVLCDMNDGGGWTVIQRRGNFSSAQDYFYRNWNDYKTGFGDLLQDFWLGNQNTFALTNQDQYILKVVLRDWEGNVTYVIYDNFWVDDEFHNYQLHVNGYRGTAGDSFTYHNEMPFTTMDRKNNPKEQNEAQKYNGAWWFGNAHWSHLNGLYLEGSAKETYNGVYWYTFRGYYSHHDSVMKIRPKNYHVE